MDNLAHSLIGAALGRATATRHMRFPGFVGALAGNAPDLSEFITGDLGPGAQYLARHRGHTHSMLGAVIELAILIAAGWLLRRRLFGADPPRARETLAALALALAPALASHLLLDWTGSYGLRPFLPWSGRWYFGDVIPIVDVVFWLVPLAVLAWGSARTRRWGVWWGLLAAAPTVLVFIAPVTTAIRVVWVTGLAVGGLGWWRGWFGTRTRQAVVA
ncbi:MAG: metal-dependent hydrolase, partial [Gemmatimonadales bacterium]